MKNLRVPLRIVFYRESQDWIAHCLEFDLVGDGPSKDEAMKGLLEAVRLQVLASVEHDNPRNLFTPADGKFFEMFAAGKDVAVGEMHLKVDSIVIDDAQAREYSESESETELIDA